MLVHPTRGVAVVRYRDPDAYDAAGLNWRVVSLYTRVFAYAFVASEPAGTNIFGFDKSEKSVGSSILNTWPTTNGYVALTIRVALSFPL